VDWPECVITIPLSLDPSCFQESTYSQIFMTFGKATTPNVNIQNIGPRRFVRLAYLGDSDIGVFENKIEGDVETTWYSSPVTKAQWATQTNGAPSSVDYRVKKMISVRGLRTNDNKTYILRGTPRTPPPPPSEPQISNPPINGLTDQTRTSATDYTPSPMTIIFPTPEGVSPLRINPIGSTSMQAGLHSGGAALSR
jgi:hypothetical protein